MTGDKFIPELHLKQSRFTYSAYGRFTKYCKRIKKFRETGNSKHFCRNKLNKACFVHDAACSDNKDSAKRTISYTILKDSAYKIARNHGYDRYQRTLASMVHEVFYKKAGMGASVNEQLAEELHKPVVKKFKRRKVYWQLKTIFG